MRWLCRALRLGSLTVFLVGFSPSCGGRSHADHDGAAAGSAGGWSTSGSGGAAGSAGGGTRQPEFVPDTPPAYTAENAVGSFEDNPGYGWDTCHTHTPERLSRQPGGSEGSTYLSFQSDDDGFPMESPSESSSASQLYFWFEAPSAITDHLYFDAKNFGAAPATGVLRFYGTDVFCGNERLLLEVTLDQLELQATWEARCVTLTGLREHQGLGLAVSSGAHSLGLDALRFGPPCRTDD